MRWNGKLSKKWIALKERDSTLIRQIKRMTNVGHERWRVQKVSTRHSIGHTTRNEWTDGKIILWLLRKELVTRTGEHRFTWQFIFSLGWHQWALVRRAREQTWGTLIFFCFNRFRTGARRWDHLSGCYVNADVGWAWVQVKWTLVTLWPITLFSKSFWFSPLSSTILKTLFNWFIQPKNAW